jgi:hypothetical protein
MLAKPKNDQPLFYEFFTRKKYGVPSRKFVKNYDLCKNIRKLTHLTIYCTLTLGGGRGGDQERRLEGHSSHSNMTDCISSL